MPSTPKPESQVAKGNVRVTAAMVRRQGVRWLTPHGRLLAHFAALDGEALRG